MLNKFAEELKEKREQSGLTIQQMASKTRIDLKFLEAIELGNFAFLPELYVKAFVKQYAKTVGLDEEITIKKYEAAKEGLEYDFTSTETNNQIEKNESSENELPKIDEPQSVVTKPIINSTTPLKSYVDEPKQNAVEDESKANKQLVVFGIASIGIIIISVLLYFFIFSKTDKIIVAETPIDDLIEQSNQRYVENVPELESTTDNEIVQHATDSLYLTFSAKETSWVFVILDNNRTKEFTLSANSKFTITAAKDFKATIGNSGGVSLLVNDKPIDFTGTSGSVRHFKLDRTGIVYLNTPPKLEQ